MDGSTTGTITWYDHAQIPFFMIDICAENIKEEGPVYERLYGTLYDGKMYRILPIGAFVEIAPDHDGKVHISKLENRRVEKVEDVLNLGDMTWVKFMGFDEKGRANFSRKDALKEMEGK